MRIDRWCPVLVLASLAGCGSGGGTDTGDGPGPGVDPFGVPMIHPTAPGGREWFLDDATVQGPEWHAETADVRSLEGGVFHTEGDSGEVRLEVPSPAGKTWWRDVEMTAYFRYAGDVPTPGQRPHFELLARGERHDGRDTAPSRIDGGVAAPAGTRTWPGYPFTGLSAVNGHCLGTSYHGNFYPADLARTVLFEKEISHIAGYAAQRGKAAVAGWSADRAHQWFGMKLVVRNSAAGDAVQLELWVDPAGDGHFEQASAVTDRAGAWAFDESTDLDGCDAAPFHYSKGMLLDFAGPWVIFRSDGMAVDFRWLSVREIGPAP